MSTRTKTILNGVFRWASLIVGICLLCAPGVAQNSTGRILGSVTDQSGAALSGATISITDLARGTTRTLTTDGSGEYAAPDLVPGAYKVRAEAKGFKSVERLNIELEVAKDARIDFSLPAGEVAETVTVTDEV
ncbi:MAG: Oar protein, partial [Acidobacteriaceae bacterium]|nr:Oar protein [Acidobacteriaceae bacterium]